MVIQKKRFECPSLLQGVLYWAIPLAPGFFWTGFAPVLWQLPGHPAWWACQHGEPASCGPGSMYLRQMKASGEGSMSFDRSPVFLLITSYCWRQTSSGLFVCVWTSDPPHLSSRSFLLWVVLVNSGLKIIQRMTYAGQWCQQSLLCPGDIQDNLLSEWISWHSWPLPALDQQWEDNLK